MACISASACSPQIYYIPHYSIVCLNYVCSVNLDALNRLSLNLRDLLASQGLQVHPLTSLTYMVLNSSHIFRTASRHLKTRIVSNLAFMHR